MFAPGQRSEVPAPAASDDKKQVIRFIVLVQLDLDFQASGGHHRMNIE